jgi:thymidine kinase
MEFGESHLITGPMGARKTSTMIENVQAYKKGNCLFVKPVKDTRGEKSKITSHDNKYSVDAFVCDTLDKAFDEVKKRCISVVGVDEIQFFDDIRGFVLACMGMGVDVYLSGLISDFKNESFGQAHLLLPHLTHVTILKSTCSHCKKHNACHSHRKTIDTEQIKVSGFDIYEALCRKCYIHALINQCNLDPKGTIEQDNSFEQLRCIVYQFGCNFKMTCNNNQVVLKMSYPLFGKDRFETSIHTPGIIIKNLYEHLHKNIIGTGK